MNTCLKAASICATLMSLALMGGCAQTTGKRDLLEQPPIVTPSSETGQNLEHLPPPTRKVDIAVYQFPDLTGKNEPNDSVAVFSRAVTQGGSGLIIDALKRAGNGGWFTVVERTGLNDLLQERQLIRATRQEFNRDAAKPLPPIRFAGVMVQGGILTYDANTMTGGLGANFLGIGANTQYRRDMVTVGVRLVSVQTGEVLTSVTTTKTVYSVGVSGSLYKFVSTDRLLQAEAGFTRNEPTQMAVRQAIDLAVYATVMEGVRSGMWSFVDPAAGRALVADYLARDKQEEPGSPPPSRPGEKVAVAGGPRG